MAIIGSIPTQAIDINTGMWTEAARRWFDSLVTRVGGQSSAVTAPSDPPYIVSTPTDVLDNEFPLSSLETGFLKVTNGTGELTSTENSLIQSSDMSETGVTAGSYTVNSVTFFTVDAAGRLTSASSAEITVTGTADKIDVSGGNGATPTITISPTYVGQSSITTLGTITTGSWTGSVINQRYLQVQNVYDYSFSGGV